MSIFLVVIHDEPRHLCNPSPCGANAICKERNAAGSCTCLSGYHGDPYSGCRPECVMNADCSKNHVCTNNKCIDPCLGTCGINANCVVYNHIPVCSCLPKFTGNPERSCQVIPSKNYILLSVEFYIFFLVVHEGPKGDPCVPSPCGPYSQCRVVNNYAVCSCQKNFIGIPPSCRPECMISADCPQNRACINNKCHDPCPNTCGIASLCQVINHNPVCSCPPNNTGDPFIRCFEIPSMINVHLKNFYNILEFQELLLTKTHVYLLHVALILCAKLLTKVLFVLVC